MTARPVMQASQDRHTPSDPRATPALAVLVQLRDLPAKLPARGRELLAPANPCTDHASPPRSADSPTNFEPGDAGRKRGSTSRCRTALGLTESSECTSWSSRTAAMPKLVDSGQLRLGPISGKKKRRRPKPACWSKFGPAFPNFGLESTILGRCQANLAGVGGRCRRPKLCGMWGDSPQARKDALCLAASRLTHAPDLRMLMDAQRQVSQDTHTSHTCHRLARGTAWRCA